MTNEQIALEWFAAFNAHDLERLLALYDNNAKHYSPKLKLRRPDTAGFIVGKNSLQSWWQDAFERLPGLTYSVTTLTSDEQRIFMEYVRSVSGEEDMFVAEVLEISKGKISASRVYHG